MLLVAGLQHQGAGAYCGSDQCYLIIKLLQPSSSVKHRIQDDKESKLTLIFMGVNVILCLERKTKSMVYDLRSSILQIKIVTFHLQD